MNKLPSIASAALIGSLFATSAFASIESYNAHYAQLRTDIPLPAKVVSPTGLPQRYEDTTIRLTFTVDTQGQPRDIEVTGQADADLAKRILPVFAQWRFTPAQENGVPVARRVEMPLKIVSDS